MTEENEKLRNSLKAAESIITNALRSQPDDDEQCKVHLDKACQDVEQTVAGVSQRSEVGMALASIVKELYNLAERVEDDIHEEEVWDNMKMGRIYRNIAGQIEDAMRLLGGGEFRCPLTIAGLI